MAVMVGASIPPEGTPPEEKRIIWAENIPYLAKERGIKLMDLAKDVDVTVSFFSRARKGEARADADVLSSIADRLGVSLDLLMKCDLSAMGRSEILLVNSLEKLVHDTVSEKIRWERMVNSDFKKLGDNGKPPYPFYRISEVEQDERIYFEYVSLFNYDYDAVDIDVDVYRTKLTEMIELFLVPVRMYKKSQDEEGTSHEWFQGMEMFFVMADGDYRPMCCTYNGTRDVIASKIRELYQMAWEKSESEILDPLASDILTDYLNDRLDQRTDCPF